MIYSLDRDVLYGFQIMVITILYAFGFLWHDLVEVVSDVYFYIHASILDWRTETFPFSSLYLASCIYSKLIE